MPIPSSFQENIGVFAPTAAALRQNWFSHNGVISARPAMIEMNPIILHATSLLAIVPRSDGHIFLPSEGSMDA
jgi:hypothetical protein